MYLDSKSLHNDMDALSHTLAHMLIYVVAQMHV